MGEYPGYADRIAPGAGLYEETPYHHAPIWAWTLALLRRLSGPERGLGAATRVFLTGVDAATAVLVFRLARRSGARSPRAAALLYLFNPVSIWVSAVQGQFENLSLMFLLAALVFAGRDGSRQGSVLSAGGWCFLSIAAKQITLLHPILWIREKRGITVPALAYAGAAALFLPYAHQWRAIGEKLLFYNSVPRSYGLSELVLAQASWGKFVGAFDLAAGLLAAWWLAGRAERARACLVLFLVLLLFAPGMGAQYLLWPIALGSVFARPQYFVFTLSSIAWTLGSHFAVPGSGRWMGHLVWLSVGLWLAGEIRVLVERRRTASAAGPGITPPT